MRARHRWQRSWFGAVVLVSLAACGGGSGSGGAGGAAPDAGAYDTAAQDCVDTINQYRDSLALPHYTRWTGEEACAGAEAQGDSDSGTPHSAFGMCGESAQNECPGWPGPPATMIPACLKMMWAEGPGADFSKHGHYINMSNPSYKQVACGFTVLKDGSVWATQDFK